MRTGSGTYAMRDENTRRPHSQLGYRTSEEFAALRAAGQSSAGPGEGISNADPFPQAPSLLNQESLEAQCEFWICYWCIEFLDTTRLHKRRTEFFADDNTVSPQFWCFASHS